MKKILFVFILSVSLVLSVNVNLEQCDNYAKVDTSSLKSSDYFAYLNAKQYFKGTCSEVIRTTAEGTQDMKGWSCIVEYKQSTSSSFVVQTYISLFQECARYQCFIQNKSNCFTQASS